MSIYRREFSFERASLNTDTGTFRAVIYTDGEASDGHILDIAGGELPERMPLFVNHNADPTTQLGVLTDPVRGKHSVEYTGQILLDGEGPTAAIRRDILLKMDRGLLEQFSGRWDASDKDVVRRVNLPSDHPAFVDSEKATSSQRWGMYFKKWNALEGSLVGLGADPAAKLRWAEEAADESVAQFWRSQVPQQVEPPSREGLLAAFAAQVRELRAAGITDEDLAIEIGLGEDEPSGPSEVEEILARLERLELSLDRPAPVIAPQPVAIAQPARIDAREVGLVLAHELARLDASVSSKFAAMLDAARGKV